MKCIIYSCENTTYCGRLCEQHYYGRCKYPFCHEYVKDLRGHCEKHLDMECEYCCDERKFAGIGKCLICMFPTYLCLGCSKKVKWYCKDCENI